MLNTARQWTLPGTDIVEWEPHPFHTPSHALYTSSYRYVSYGVKLTCISPTISAEGVVSYCQLQQPQNCASYADVTLDLVVNTPGSKTEPALVPHYLTWTPKGVDDRMFDSATRT